MPDIESLLKEKRVFDPNKEFARQANWNAKTIREYRKLMKLGYKNIAQAIFADWKEAGYSVDR